MEHYKYNLYQSYLGGEAPHLGRCISKIFAAGRCIFLPKVGIFSKYSRYIYQHHPKNQFWLHFYYKFSKNFKKVLKNFQISKKVLKNFQIWKKVLKIFYISKRVLKTFSRRLRRREKLLFSIPPVDGTPLEGWPPQNNTDLYNYGRIVAHIVL